MILKDHYHILFQTSKGSDLPIFFWQLHGWASFELNKKDDRIGRQVWHNDRDTCVRAESDYWSRLNYIHHNPVKHGYVICTEDWPFSSYHYYLANYGPEWLADVNRRYPVIDFTDPLDDD